jgi:hypothetical protein
MSEGVSHWRYCLRLTPDPRGSACTSYRILSQPNSYLIGTVATYHGATRFSVAYGSTKPMALLAHHPFQSAKLSRAIVSLTVRCSYAGLYTFLVGYTLGSLVLIKLHQLHVPRKHIRLFRPNDAELLSTYMHAVANSSGPSGFRADLRASIAFVENHPSTSPQRHGQQACSHKVPTPEPSSPPAASAQPPNHVQTPASPQTA